MLRASKAALAGALLLISAGMAAAAPGVTTASLKLRAGPGTGFGVLTTMPNGAGVHVLGCGPEGWCRVMFAGFTGYANATYLSVGPGGPVAVAVAPPVAVIVPGPVYGYGPYYGYRAGWGYRGGWRRW
jgi:uncharacterized protein YraI